MILTELYTALKRWLLAAASSKDVIALGQILCALEELIEHGVAPGSGDAEINPIPEAKGGIGAQLSLSSEAIIFGLMEYFYLGNQGCDHAPVLDAEGRPFYLEFTPDGSFSRVEFDFWLSHTNEFAPVSDGEGGAEVMAHWFSKGG